MFQTGGIFLKRHNTDLSNILSVRTHLVDNSPTFEAFCKALVGLHSARVQSPVSAWVARYPGANAHNISFLREMKQSCSALRMRSVRGTLHYHSPQDIASFHQATLKKRLSVCNNMARNLNAQHINYFSDAILDLLQEGKLEPREIETVLCRYINEYSQDDIFCIRVALKTLWEKGEIILRDTHLIWNKEKRVFSLPDKKWQDLLNENTAKGNHLRHIVDRYLQSYGPATLKDIVWWSGLAAGKILAALAEVLQEGKATRFQLNGLEFFDTTRTRLLKEENGTVHFFGWEETVFKAYHETRFRYISPKHYTRAFNKIGEIRRTIFRDSQIIGVWEVDSEGIPNNYEIFDKTNKADKTTIKYAFEACRLRYKIS